MDQSRFLIENQLTGTPSDFQNRKGNMAIFWVSGPVKPGEMLMIVGAFSNDVCVELVRLEDQGVGEPSSQVLGRIGDWEWTKVPIVFQSQSTLYIEIPQDWKDGLMVGKISQDQEEVFFFVNSVNVWWLQGDVGIRARVGGWIEIYGRCLARGKQSYLALKTEGMGHWQILKCEQISDYGLWCALPHDLESGWYEVQVHNGFGGVYGWQSSGRIEILPKQTNQQSVILNIKDYGAVPNSDQDCTIAIVQALERLQALKGGVLYFPRGRYRINGGLRSGMWMDHSLRIPPNVTLRGEGMELVSLYWPDREQPLPSLIEAFDSVTIENLTIYTQGRHRNVISAQNNLSVHHVRIRANCYLHLDYPGRPHRGRNVTEPHTEMGAAIECEGDNISITHCDILHSGIAIKLKNVRGAYITHNRIRHGQCYLMSYGGEKVVFKHNHCEGAHLCSTGASIALFFGATICRHHYIGHNYLAHMYGGDRETITFDGHGTAYFGTIQFVEGNVLQLKSKPVFSCKGREGFPDPYDIFCYIVAGQGQGQYQRVVSIEEDKVIVESPWKVPPDESSIVTLGAFNGRHLIVGNTIEDSGAMVQLFPPNVECIIAHNVGRRVYPIKIWGKVGWNMDTGLWRIEPSWFNQVLDNVIEEGNGWGRNEGGLLVWGEWAKYSIDQYGAEVERNLTKGDVQKYLEEKEEVQNRKGYALFPITCYTVVRNFAIRNNATVWIKGQVQYLVMENINIGKNEDGIVLPSSLQAIPHQAEKFVFQSQEGVFIKNLFCSEVDHPILRDDL